MSATFRPYAKSFACGGVVFLLAVAALFVFLGTPGPDAEPGEAIGYLLAATALAGGVSGYLVKKSSRAWPLWQIAALYLAVLLACLAIAAYGRHH